MKVLFVVDAGASIGGGHVMRCLTLATAMRRSDVTTAFLAPPAVAAILDPFAPDEVGRLAIPQPTSLDLLAHAAADAARGFAADLLVFDHYGLAAPHHRIARQHRPALVIDDLADRPLDASLVMDPGAHRRRRDYAALTEARVLVGPTYALVRDEFVEARPLALARSAAWPVRRALVSMGLTDVGGVTGRVVARLMKQASLSRIDVLIGPGTESDAALQDAASRDPRLQLQGLRTDLADLMAEADICIGAGGATTWERSVLGLPSIAVIVAENQRENIEALASQGATLACDAAAPDFDDAFDGAIRRLIDDADLRNGLSTVSAALCDGGGAERVSEACQALFRP